MKRTVEWLGSGTILITAAVFLSLTPLEAQERRSESPAAKAPVPGASNDGSPGTAGATLATAAQPGRPESPGVRKPVPYHMPPLRQALFEEMHNKTVHFPIVLALFGVLLLILARRRPELETMAFWTVWASTLGALVAYFSGISQAAEFKGEPKEWLVGLHQKVGMAVALAQAAWVLMLLRQPSRRFAWIWGLVVVGLVLAAAFLGGIVAHGE